MRCPHCGHAETKVIDSRPADEGAEIRRRRECESCGRRFTTFERCERDTGFLVVKRDGRREQYRREKIRAGIDKACEKRAVSAADRDAAVEAVDRAVVRAAGNGREMSSQVIGDLVMEQLKELDHVAYIRFASIYKRFQAADDFNYVLRELRDQAARAHAPKRKKPSAPPDKAGELPLKP